MTQPSEPTLACGIPHNDSARILLSHGGGGRHMHRLLEEIFLPAFDNLLLAQRHDGAVFAPGAARLAFTTDSYVVRPLFFPGGDIGSLAVNGTVNDLAMCGARPLYLSAAFILEEGLEQEVLRRVALSMKEAAAAAGVQIVTGDTKVVERGKGDGLYITTSGVGAIEHDKIIASTSVRAGDAVLLSGDIGRHGMAIMAAREELAFESPLSSDCAPLAEPALALLSGGIEVHCLRDLTRGGLATGLVEIAQGSNLAIHINEQAIGVPEEVRGACELLGFDPLYVANEGRMIAFVPAEQADEAIAILRAFPTTGGACRIGEVHQAPAGLVSMTSVIGSARVIDLLSGEQLPRIC